MKIYWLIALACTFLSNPALSMEYQWPAITAISYTNTGPENGIWDISLSPITIRDDSIEEGMLARDVFTQKGLSDEVFPTVGIIFRKKINSGPIAGTVQAGRHHFIDVVGRRETFRSLTDTISAITSARISVDNIRLSDPKCFAVRVWTSFTYSTWDYLSRHSWDGGAPAQGPCFVVPPANQWCALTTPTLIFDYGTIHVTNAAGTRKSANVKVKCTTGMKFTLRLLGTESISLSNNMRAQITANGAPLNTAIDGQAGSNEITLTSELQGVPDSAGPYHGTGALFISYP